MGTTTTLALSITADGKIAVSQIDAVSGAADRLQKSIKTSEAQAGGLAAALRNVGRLGVAYLGGEQVYEFAKSIAVARLEADRLQQTYAYAFGSVAAGARNLDYVREAASRLGTDLSSSANAYGKLAAASVGTALEGQKTRGIFEAVSKAATVMGLSAEESNGALLAISQMMSKGTVQAEELRGQLGERIPGAFQMAARAMGVTTAELGKMLEQGQVLSADFLPKFAAEMERSLGDSSERAANSMQASLNRMSAAWEKFKQSLSGAAGSGGDSGLGGAASWLATTLDDAAGQMDRVAKNGHGLIARMFVGLSAGNARLLGALLGVDASGTSTGIARGDDWMTAQLTRIRTLERKLEATPKDFIYERSRIGNEISEERTRYGNALAVRNRRGIDLPSKSELAAEAAKTAEGVQSLQKDMYDNWLKAYAASSPVVAARQAIKDYEKQFEPLKTQNPEAYKLGMDPLTEKLRKAQQSGHKKPRAQGKVSFLSNDADDIAEVLRRNEKAEADAERQLEAYGRAVQALAEPEERRAEQLREQVRNYGLTADEIDRVALANLEYARAAAAAGLADETSAASAQAQVDILDRLIAAKREAIGATEELRQKDADWHEGATAGLKAYVKSVDNVAGTTGAAFQRGFQLAEDAATSFVRKGKLDIGSLADYVIDQMIRINMVQPMLKSVAAGNGSGGFLGSIGRLFGMGGDGGGYMGGGGFAWDAKGDVHQSSSLHRYVNTVQDSPRFFQFAKGGVFAEAGPEAVMPLARDASGRLGVRSQGEGGGVVVNVIEAPGKGGQVQRRQEAGADIIDILVEKVRGAMNADIANEGPLASSIQRTYGLNRAAGAN